MMRRSIRGPLRAQRAQSTVEYALVLLGAAALALLLVSWVTRPFDVVLSVAKSVIKLTAPLLRFTRIRRLFVAQSK